jgi:hypothetical protein
LTTVPSADGNVEMETTPIPSRRKADVVEVVTPPDPVLSSAQLAVAKDEGRTRKILVRVTSGALMVRFSVRYRSGHLGESCSHSRTLIRLPSFSLVSTWVMSTYAHLWHSLNYSWYVTHVCEHLACLT